jgi:radical SAM protein with 4Fe4S-binding SPASM domain
LNLIRMDDEHHFYEVFNPDSGFYLRSDVIGSDGEPIKNTDPFMRSFPMLLDIGIMGHCDNAEKGLCRAGKLDCYQSGNVINRPHMTLDNYKEIMRQSKGNVFQVAVGGRGDPNKHPDFEEILKTTKESNIVPNYTTSGLDLTDKEIELTKKYCGAVAVSEQRGEHTNSALKRFIDAGCKTNIHYVLGNHTLDEAIEILKGNKEVPEGLNAIVFLLYKPVGNGTYERVIKADDPRLDIFCELIGKERKYKLGFDACSVSLLVLKCQATVNMMSLDSCEASRFSAYLTSDMILLPCSFDQNHRWGVEITKTKTIKEAWDSRSFETFRNKMKNSCKACSLKSQCFGGCPIVPEITLCNRKERDNNMFKKETI